MPARTVERASARNAAKIAAAKLAAPPADHVVDPNGGQPTAGENVHLGTGAVTGPVTAPKPTPPAAKPKAAGKPAEPKTPPALKPPADTVLKQRMTSLVMRASCDLLDDAAALEAAGLTREFAAKFLAGQFSYWPGCQAGHVAWDSRLPAKTALSTGAKTKKP